LNAVAQALGEQGKATSHYLLNQALDAGQAISAYSPKVEVLSAITSLKARFDTLENTQAALVITKAQQNLL